MFIGINGKAICLGFLVSCVSGVLGICFFEAMIAIYAGGLGHWVPGHYQANQYFLDLTKSVPIRLLGIGIYGIGSVLGGLVTGRLAPSHRLKNVFTLAIIDIILIGISISDLQQYSLWLTAGKIVITATSTMLGGFLSKGLWVGKGKETKGLAQM